MPPSLPPAASPAGPGFRETGCRPRRSPRLRNCPGPPGGGCSESAPPQGPPLRPAVQHRQAAQQNQPMRQKSQHPRLRHRLPVGPVNPRQPMRPSKPTSRPLEVSGVRNPSRPTLPARSPPSPDRGPQPSRSPAPRPCCSARRSKPARQLPPATRGLRSPALHGAPRQMLDKPRGGAGILPAPRSKARRNGRGTPRHGRRHHGRPGLMPPDLWCRKSLDRKKPRPLGAKLQ